MRCASLYSSDTKLPSYTTRGIPFFELDLCGPYLKFSITIDLLGYESPVLGKAVSFLVLLYSNSASGTLVSRFIQKRDIAG